MNAFVKDLEPNEWRIAHCHHNSLHLNESEHLLDQWRFEVEAQGCAFVGNIMLRESLSHTLSLYKHLRRYNSTDDDWTMHLKSPSELGHWATELDFFLYNNLARNPVSSGAEVRQTLANSPFLTSLGVDICKTPLAWSFKRRKGQTWVRTAWKTLRYCNSRQSRQIQRNIAENDRLERQRDAQAQYP